MDLKECWGNSLQFIIEPNTFQLVPIQSPQGLQILRQLIKSYNYYKQSKKQSKTQSKTQSSSYRRPFQLCSMSSSLQKIQRKHKKQMSQIHEFSSYHSIQEVTETSDSEYSE